MKNAKIIAIVGMPGSGKGTITDEFKKRGYPVIHFGNMVYEEVEKRGLNIIEAEVKVRHDMRRLDGPAVLAKRVAQKADKLTAKGNEVVVLDGLYTWTEYKYLASKYPQQLTIIAVVAPRKLRWKRASDRKDNRRKYTLDDVRVRDLDEIENMEKGGPIAYADFYINNDGPMEEFHKKLDKLFAQLKIEF